MMERQDIYDAIVDIMFRDGPDGHTDGSDVLTDFVEAALQGKGTDWIEKYRSEGAARQFKVTPVPGEDTIVDKDVDVPPIVLIPRSSSD